MTQLHSDASKEQNGEQVMELHLPGDADILKLEAYAQEVPWLVVQHPNITPDLFETLAEHHPMEALKNPSLILFELEQPGFWLSIEKMYMRDWISSCFMKLNRHQTCQLCLRFVNRILHLQRKDNDEILENDLVVIDKYPYSARTYYVLTLLRSRIKNKQIASKEGGNVVEIAASRALSSLMDIAFCGGATATARNAIRNNCLHAIGLQYGDEDSLGYIEARLQEERWHLEAVYAESKTQESR